jgi:hypothetical protein
MLVDSEVILIFKKNLKNFQFTKNEMQVAMILEK